MVDVFAGRTAATASWGAWVCAAAGVQFEGAPGAFELGMVPMFLGGCDG
jgi:hypothetical protein